MKHDRVYIEQILEAVIKIKQFTAGYTHEQFLADQKTQSAVIMQLALLGELAKKLSPKTKEKIPLPWNEIIGFRNRAIHDYYQVELEIVWQTVLEDIQEVEQQITAFLQTSS